MITMKYMKWISELIKSKTTLVVVAIYILVSFWFYWDHYWIQIAYDRSQAGWEVTGEIRASEWGIEQILGKLDRGENPFSRIDSIMYPYGVDVVASDPGLAFLVAPFRQFFSVHQSLVLVVVLGMIIGGLGMYKLLIELKIMPMAAFAVGLAYANNTFIMPRLGHVGFLASFWVFPWFGWLLLRFVNVKKAGAKIAFTILLATLYLASLWINFYYFVILNLGIGMMGVYYLWTSPKVLISNLVKYLGYISVALGVLLGLGATWFKTLQETLKFSEVAKPQGWGGAIEFSADLFNVFVPSVYNHYYGEFVSKIFRQVTFTQGIFEDYNYPGILIILAIVLSSYLIIKKSDLGKKILPHYLAAIGFGILTLGPFLQVAGRMYLELEEVIRVVVPLPFALLHYLPYFNNLRVPGRLAIGMIFFGLICVGIILDALHKTLPKKYLTRFWIIVILIIVFDQRPAPMRLEEIAPNYPAKLYQTIRQDPEEVSVLHVPFTVRDGLTWFGEYNVVSMDFAQTYIEKPLIGGYVGRIPDYVKEYYRSNPFVGKIGRIIDQNLASNPFMLNVPERDLWRESLDDAKASVDLLRTKYALVAISPENSCTRYTQVEDFLKAIGFTEFAVEGKYRLYIREQKNREFTQIELGTNSDNLQLGMGWWSRETGFRWAQKKNSVILRNSESGKYRLVVSGSSFFKPQRLEMYLDEKKIGQVTLGTEMQTNVSVVTDVAPGLHIVHLIFEEEWKPSEVIPGNLDTRSLAGKISTIKLERVQ